MPDATALDRGRAAGDKPQGVPGGNPDRVGEELADDAHIWRVYGRVAKEDDDRRVANWNRGLDNLALFAGLFSAVTTAFIIESQKDMKPDYLQLTFFVLNATAFDQPFIPTPFVVPAGARTTNSLWIPSLVLSLSAALIAIMGKDWIGMYMSRPVCNPRQWAEMRTYRLRCVERWYMPGVIAAAPVLLHVSLLLFGAVLVTFIAQDSLTHHLTLGLSLTAGLLYFVTALSAIIFPGSPFKSPATQMIRAALLAFIIFLRDTFSRPRRNLLPSLQRAIDALIAPGLNVAGDQHDIDGTPETNVDPLTYRRIDIALRFLEYAIDRPPDTLVRAALNECISLTAAAEQGWLMDLQLVILKLRGSLRLPDLHDLTQRNVGQCRTQLLAVMRDDLQSQIDTNKKLYLLRNRKGPVLALRRYLLIDNAQHREAITQLLLSCHGLAVERLRWPQRYRARVDFKDRLCRLCLNSVETPEHVLLTCTASPQICDLRSSFLNELHARSESVLGPTNVSEPIPYLRRILSQEDALAMTAKWIYETLELVLSVDMYVPSAYLLTA